MTRDEAIPILLGFLNLEFRRWLAEEDTPKGHYDNIKKGIEDHKSVIIDIMESKIDNFDK